MLRVEVLGVPISQISWDNAVSRLVAWGRAREPRYVCICNVHSVISATESPHFLEAVRCSDMATPDGAPVAWFMRMRGAQGQERINGPDLMHRYLMQANGDQDSVYLLGGAEDTLARLVSKIERRYPNVKIAGVMSPPFRQLTDLENNNIIADINNSGAAVVWISLGCPKQELWMYENRGRIAGVLVGVGAAFEYLAGTRRRAPQWLQRLGLEWGFRLAAEPRRLWRRYFYTNTKFIVKAAIAVLR